MNPNEKDVFVVEGEIIISSGVHQFENGVAHISLVDTTCQDIRSVPLAKTVIFGVRHGVSETILVFQLEFSDPDRFNPKNDYGVQVWIDTDGSGKPKAVDLFTDRQYSVLTHGFGNNLAIRFDGS